ncbi:MAG: helix-turn-helix domain-containing protein [Candidatus Promineifilaceae bacterium]
MTEDEHGATWLHEHFHPEGLSCPRCGTDASQARLFRRTKRSQLDVYRCFVCDQAFNLYTGTPFEGKHLRPIQVVLLLRGLNEGKSNPRLAGELGLNRTTVYYLRRELQEAGAVQPDGGIVTGNRHNEPQKPDGRGSRHGEQES